MTSRIELASKFWRPTVHGGCWPNHSRWVLLRWANQRPQTRLGGVALGGDGNISCICSFLLTHQPKYYSKLIITPTSYCYCYYLLVFCFSSLYNYVYNSNKNLPYYYYYYYYYY